MPDQEKSGNLLCLWKKTRKCGENKEKSLLVTIATNVNVIQGVHSGIIQEISKCQEKSEMSAISLIVPNSRLVKKAEYPLEKKD